MEATRQEAAAKVGQDEISWSRQKILAVSWWELILVAEIQARCSYILVDYVFFAITPPLQMCHAVFIFHDPKLLQTTSRHSDSKLVAVASSWQIGAECIDNEGHLAEPLTSGPTLIFDVGWCGFVNRIAQDGESLSLSIPHFQSQWVISSLWFRPLCSHHDICVILYHDIPLWWLNPYIPMNENQQASRFPTEVSVHFRRSAWSEDCKAWRFPVHKSVCERGIW